MVVLVPPLHAQQPQGPQAVVARSPANGNVPRASTPIVQSKIEPRVPDWIPLNARHQEYLDQVLGYWEKKSDQIKRYRCTFKRWEYDPVFGPKDTYRTYAEGVIKYAAPDKGLYRVEKVKQYQPPAERGGQPQYPEAGDMLKEHWVCDGQSIFEFDYTQKHLVQRQLPPDMRGKAIGKGPLPFLFNANVSDIKRRFWLHIITPPSAKGEYWLEAIPKTQEDAANFTMVHVIIDESDYLPKAMVLFDGEVKRGASPASRTSFRFEHREVNFSILAQQLNLFHREFYEPKTMTGWTKIVEKWNQPAIPQQQPGPGNRTANEDGNPRR